MCNVLNIILAIYHNYHKNDMDKEEIDEFIYEFHERVLGIEPEENERPEWDWLRRK